MKENKKLLALCLAAVMAASTSTVVFAESETQAPADPTDTLPVTDVKQAVQIEISLQSKNGEVIVSTAGEFIAALDGPDRTIKLDQSINLSDVGELNVSNHIIDLNGCTIIAQKHSGKPTTCFVGTNFTIKNGGLSSGGASYALYIGDQVEYDTIAAHVVVENITTDGGINIFNSTDVILKDVTVTGKDFYAVWCDKNAHAIIEGGTFSTNGNAVLGLSSSQEYRPSMEILGGTFNSNEKPLVLKGQNSSGSPYGSPVIKGGNYDCNPIEYIPSTHDEIKHSDTKFTVGQYTEDQAQQLGMAAKVRSSEGVDIYYRDWQEAKTAAAANQNLTILKNVEEDMKVPEGAELTIWNNVKVTGNIENNGELTLRPGAQVTGNISGSGDVTYVKEPSGGGSSIPGTGAPITTGGRWVQSPAGWWYRNADGTWPANQWKYLDGGNGRSAWYWFNQNGYITFGWQYINGNWYYMNRSGEMQTGWQFINNKWYYLNQSGAMATGWVQDGGKWYYMNDDGSMHFGWLNWAGYWYHLDSHGIMSTGWKYINGEWYYLYPANGRMAANTTTPDGYRVDESGAWIR